MSLTARDALKKIIEIVPANSEILDIGAGKDQPHATLFREHNFKVDTVDFFENSTYIGNFNDIDIPKQYDVVWAAHCLEHQPNVNFFLKKIYNLTKVGGYVCLTVPPLKHQIVGGHLNLWNGGLLVYNLVLAGFDCSNAKIKQYSYNISVIVQKNDSIIPFETLEYDTNDLVTLNKFFPKGLRYKGKFKMVFNGNIEEHNW